MRPPPTTDGEQLSAMPFIADQVSALVSFVFLLLVQQQDTILDSFHHRSLPQRQAQPPN
jgi:hypothetical protein